MGFRFEGRYGIGRKLFQSSPPIVQTTEACAGAPALGDPEFEAQRAAEAAEVGQAPPAQDSGAETVLGG